MSALGPILLAIIGFLVLLNLIKLVIKERQKKYTKTIRFIGENSQRNYSNDNHSDHNYPNGYQNLFLQDNNHHGHSHQHSSTPAENHHSDSHQHNIDTSSHHTHDSGSSFDTGSSGFDSGSSFGDSGSSFGDSGGSW